MNGLKGLKINLLMATTFVVEDGVGADIRITITIIAIMVRIVREVMATAILFCI